MKVGIWIVEWWLVLCLSLQPVLAAAQADRFPTEKEKKTFRQGYERACNKGVNIRRGIELMGGSAEHVKNLCACISGQLVEPPATYGDLSSFNKKSRLWDIAVYKSARDSCVRRTFPLTERTYNGFKKELEATWQMKNVLYPNAHNKVYAVLVVETLANLKKPPGETRNFACVVLRSYPLFDTELEVTLYDMNFKEGSVTISTTDGTCN